MAHRGERHHKAKLNSEKAAEIRKLYRDWKAAGSRKGYRELAWMFGVNLTTIRDVVIGKTWVTQHLAVDAPSPTVVE